MARLGCFVLCALVAGGSSSCLLYTDVINHPPTVKVVGPAVADWGKVPYRADAGDKDQPPESLIFEWRLAVGPAATACPKTLAAAQERAALSFSVEFEAHPPAMDEFCVWVVVKDKEQAAAFAVQATRLTHKEPTAFIDVVSPRSATAAYPLFSTFQLSGARSEDVEQKEKLTFRWSLSHGGQAVAPVPCLQAADSDVCFTADTPGEYLANLTVKDVRGTEAKAPALVLTVEPDAPPCIRQTEPPFALSKIVREDTDLLDVRLITVEDDGDPFPETPGKPSEYSFVATWWLRGQTGPPERRAGGLREERLTFTPPHFKPGDEVFVRMQVKDRVPRDFSECEKANASECALGKDKDCFQWVTWKFDIGLGRNTTP